MLVKYRMTVSRSFKQIEKEQGKTNLLEFLAIVLMIVIQCGSQLLLAPGAKNADQSVLFTYFSYEHLIKLVCVIQSNVSVNRYVLRSISTN